jgi:hypothetical protein
MPTYRGILIFLSVFSSAVLGGCTADTGDDGDAADIDGTDQDLTSTFELPANGSKTLRITARSTKDVVLTIDCAPPSDPDAVGPVLKVSSSTLGIASSDPARAGYYRRAGSVPAGDHSITVQNAGGPARCSLRSTSVASSATCRAWNEWRSPNTDHTHLRVGQEAIQAGWEPFPASGNHWGAWARWSTIYDKPIKRGYLLHNLEHGGLVFSYKCSSPNDSAACKSARDQLVALANAFGQPRLLITPDPTQPTMFAVRGWRYAYTSDCLDMQSAGAFAREHYRHGREDADANPPIPFDPTGLAVPCEDLMAAPDSCAR